MGIRTAPSTRFGRYKGVIHAAADSNVAFNKVIGDDVRKLSGVTVDPMRGLRQGGPKGSEAARGSRAVVAAWRDDLLGRRTAQVGEDSRAGVRRFGGIQ